MSERTEGKRARFVVASSSHELPHDGGRVTRFTIDVDARAVARYVFEHAGNSDEWPIVLIEEFLGVIHDYAVREGNIAMMADTWKER